MRRGWLGAGLWLLCTLVAPAQAQTMVKYVHTDALGSVVAMTNGSGAVVETTREYEPYGLQLMPGIQDGPGYAGHVQDATTGFTYMQQRYYDPMLGVFLSTDPVTAYRSPVTQFNRYRYGNSNPYKFKDPDGRAAIIDRMKDGSINVSFPTKFVVGQGVTKEQVAAVKESVAALSGTYKIDGKDTKVNFAVTEITKDTPRAARNEVRLTAGPTERQSGLSAAVVGGRKAWIDVTHAPGKGGTPAHEFLHLAGDDDVYDLRTRQPDPEYGNNIMNVVPGVMEDRNMNIIMGARTNVFRREAE